MPAKKPIQSIVLTSDTNSVTFSGIDQSYTDLQLIINGTLTASNSTYRMQFNGDTSGVYSFTTMGATSGGAATYIYSSYSYINFFIMNGGPSTSTATSCVDIFNYSSTATKKNCLLQNGIADGEVSIITGLWSSTAAISSVTIYTSSGSLAAGTTLDLYGISPVNAKISSASGGTDIFYDSTYAYHVFKGTGIFTPNRALSADILVIGGGGAGNYGTDGVNYGAGGASGIVRTGTQTLSAGSSYTVTVGAGGPYSGTTQSNGTSSTFIGTSTITATAGNGSGTGATGASNADYSGSAGQGGTSSGGGAGSAGSASGKNGGAATSAYSAWASATSTGVGGAYAGGGAGYNAGSGTTTGGGGTYGVSGVTNTGSGGNTAAGGSGIVIVRYAR